MKILIITRDYPPRVGGIGNVTINLEKKFKHFRNKVKLINFDGTSINNI
jgi:glycosyltransferase involved in cell wall biosynthesis